MNRFKRMSGTTIAVFEIVRVFLIVAGGFILMTNGSRAYEAYNSQFWPTTTGEINLSTVDAYGDILGNRSYRSRVRYAYTVGSSTNDDEPLTSERIGVYPSPKLASRSLAEAELELYPKGLSVEVYYNPNRPEKSLLKPVFLLSYLLMPGLGLICFAAAFTLWRIQKSANR
ncbi:MAG: DUF3592 domain-containing protein [Chloroflexota bacterium]